jgi:Thioredoxin-like domain
LGLHFGAFHLPHLAFGTKLVACSGWDPSIKGFISSMNMFGMPPAVRRNALHLQVVSDPLSRDTFALQSTLMRMYVDGLPLRIGAIFVLEEDAELADKRRLRGAAEALPFDEMSLASQFVRCGNSATI